LAHQIHSQHMHCHGKQSPQTWTHIPQEGFVKLVKINLESPFWEERHKSEGIVHLSE
jgi:hypothetical protein